MNRMIHIIAAALVFSAVAAIGEESTVTPISTSAYVQSGSEDLLAHLDAIENAGKGIHVALTNEWVDLAGKLEFKTNKGTSDFIADAWVPTGTNCFFSSSEAVKNAIKNKAFTLEMVISHLEPTTRYYGYWVTIGSSGSRNLILEMRDSSTESANPLINAVEYCMGSWQSGSAIKDDSGETEWNRRQYIAVVCDSNGAVVYCDGLNKIYHNKSMSITPSSENLILGGNWGYSGLLRSGSEVCAVRMTARALTAEELKHNFYIDSQRFNLLARPDGYTNINNVVYVRLAKVVDGIEYSKDGGQTWAKEVWGQINNEVTLFARYAGGETAAEICFNNLPEGAVVEGNSVRFTPKEAMELYARDQVKSSIDLYAQSGSDFLLAHLDAIENAGTGVHVDSTNGWADLTGNLELIANSTARFSDNAWVADGATYFSSSSFDAATNAIANKAFTLEMVISHPKRLTPTFEYWMSLGKYANRSLVVELREYYTQIKNPLVHAIEYCESAWEANRSAIFSDTRVTKWNERQYIAVVCNSTGATTYCNGANKIHETEGGGVAPGSSFFRLGGSTWDNAGSMLADGSEICAVRMTSRALNTAELQHNYFVDSVRFMGASATSGTTGYRVFGNAVQTLISYEGKEYKFSTDGGSNWTEDYLASWHDIGAEVEVLVQKKDSDNTLIRFTSMPSGATRSGNTVSFTASRPGSLVVDTIPAVDLYAQYAQSDSSDLLAHLDAIENAGKGVHNASAIWTDLTGKLTLAKTGSAEFTIDSWKANASSCFTTSSEAVKNAINGGAFTLEMVISHSSSQKQYENWFYVGDGNTKRLLTLDMRSNNSKNPLVQGLQYRTTGWNDVATIKNYDGKKTKWGTRQYIAVVCNGTTATAYYNGTNFLHSTVGSVSHSVDGIGIGASPTGGSKLTSGAEICSVRMTKRVLTPAEIMLNHFIDSERFNFTSVPAGYRVNNGKVQVRLTSSDDDVQISADGGKTWASEAWVNYGEEVKLRARSISLGYTSAFFTDEGLIKKMTAGGRILTFKPDVPVTIGVSPIRVLPLFDSMFIVVR